MNTYTNKYGEHIDKNDLKAEIHDQFKVTILTDVQKHWSCS